MERQKYTRDGLPRVEMKTVDEVFAEAVPIYECADRLRKSGVDEYARSPVKDWFDKIEADQSSIINFMAMYYRTLDGMSDSQKNLVLGGMISMYELLRRQAEKDIVIDLRDLDETKDEKK